MAWQDPYDSVPRRRGPRIGSPGVAAAASDCSQLPGQSREVVGTPGCGARGALGGRMTVGSIVVPAHNEAAVIVRTVSPLAPLLACGVEIIVSANGCTDDTATQARTIAGVVALVSPMPSKA